VKYKSTHSGGLLRLVVQHQAVAGRAQRFAGLHRATAELITREGTWCVFRSRVGSCCFDIASQKLPGSLSATMPDEVEPSKFDLVVLGMQEAPVRLPRVRELMGRACPSICALPGDHEHAAFGLPHSVFPGWRWQFSNHATPNPPRLDVLRSRPHHTGESRSLRPFARRISPRTFSRWAYRPTSKRRALRSRGATALLRHLESDIDQARFDPEAMASSKSR